MTTTNSFNVEKKYGLSRINAINIAEGLFSIHPSVRDLLSAYYILHWDPELFQRKLKDGTVTRWLNRDGGEESEQRTYKVIYHRTNAVEVLKTKNKLHLSFRELQPEFGHVPVVLVSLSRPE